MHRHIGVMIVSGVLIIGKTSHATDDISTIFDDVMHLDLRRASVSARHAVEAHPKGSPEWAVATLGLAMSLHHRQPDIKGDKLHAAKLYAALIAAKTGSPTEPIALILNARLAGDIDYFGDKVDVEKATVLYEEILKNWSDTFYADIAIYHFSELELSLMKAESSRVAIERLRSWLLKRPDNRMAALQWALIGTSSFRTPLNDYAGAIDAYENALKIGLPKSIPLDSFYWRLAGIAEKDGNSAKAIEYYGKIITEVTRSSFGYDSQLRIKALGGNPPDLIDPFDDGIKKDK